MAHTPLSARMSSSHARLLSVSLLTLVLLFGAWLRFPTAKSRERKGVDEAHYERYVDALRSHGIGYWPDLVESYIEQQKKEPYAFLPPTRVLFLFSAYVFQGISTVSSLEAVRWISFLAGLATLGLAAIWGWRIRGPSTSLGVTALTACSPLLIHLSHRALIDGFFAFWALFALIALWECLQCPDNVRWRLLYGAGLAALVLTKENAAFVFVAVLGILVANRWLAFGNVNRELWFTTFIGPTLGVAILMLAAGGLQPLLEAYQLNVQKSVALPYAIATGDGPWHRYLLDFLLVSPIPVSLAVMSFGIRSDRTPLHRFLIVFLLLSYALMAQVRFGMNMRYGAMWEVPIRCLALSAVVSLAIVTPERFRTLVASALVALVCLSDLNQYRRIFADANVYDPVAGALTQPLLMYKPGLSPKDTK